MEQSHLQSLIESILFVSDKPLSTKKIALLTGVSSEDAHCALAVLAEQYTHAHGRGIVLVQNDDRYQFSTNPAYADLMRTILKEDSTGELTRPALETLSVISYRGPVTKPEIEEIRGVNCSLSLRNLLIRGLIEGRDDSVKGEKVYVVSHEYLRSLGLTRINDLPNYQILHTSQSSHAGEAV